MHHWLAICVVTIGLVLVGVITDMFKEKGKNDKDTPPGGST